MIELSDSNFYYLKLRKKEFLFTNYNKATKELKKKIDELNISDIDEEDIALFKVKIDEEEEWTIKETSWFDFALELMKEN